MHPRVPGQVDARIAGQGSTHNLEIMPDEQWDELLSSFCEGVELIYGWQFKDLLPHGDDIWELKRPDIRVFGWFQSKDCFVVTAVDAVWKLKEISGLYASYIRQAIADRAELVDDGSWVKGNDPNEVVSNWCEAPQEGGG